MPYQIAKTLRGFEYPVWRPTRMPRLPDRNLESCFFVYDTEDEARRGLPTGGSGVFIHIPTSDDPRSGHVYAVTNRHVVDPDNNGKATPTIRINTKDGGIDAFETTLSEWRFPDTGDDLAVRYMQFGPEHSWKTEEITNLADESIIAEYGIGIGDEVFSIGRFVDEDGGKLQNRPVARFGCVARMPEIPVLIKKDRYHPSYLVEMRSRTGFSGSPVYVYIPWLRTEFVERKINMKERHGPWLLGIHWGQLPVVGPDAYEIGEGPETKYTTGMTAIVPAHRLKKFLMEDPLLKDQRMKNEEHWRKKPTAALESAKSAQTDENPRHKEDFTALLNAAAKKTPQGGQT